jgi:3-deoxy-7-phosphoheptulonate synthase
VLRPDVLDQRAAGLRRLSGLPAAQQPPWEYHARLPRIRAELAELPALVDHHDVAALRGRLAGVERGAALLLHVGECAELFSMASAAHVTRRAALYRGLAERLSERSGREVVLLTRMAGQHAKPRSQSCELLANGTSVPVYRGDAVNDLSPAGRLPDPWRLLTSYDRSRDTLEHLRADPVFVSHEALLRDYEEPLTRPGDELQAASSHYVWIGDRTRKLWNWHVQWASAIANPVGVKLGPTASVYDVVDLVHALNPGCVPGRLSLIPRLGARGASRTLAPLVRAVGESRSRVVWQCDPMHGNTKGFGRGKVRLLPDIRAEITAFVRTLRAAGAHPGGLHLEVTPDDVRECHEELPTHDRDGDPPPCDPRLNPVQAARVVDHFATEISRRTSS